jgi:hypothetical protein
MSTNSNLPAQTETAPVTAIGLGDSKSFDLIQRVAKCMAMSTLVPKAFQNNLPNCIIALNMAGRMNADPLMVCQNLYVVHGTPAWSAQFLIATFNKSGKFSSIRYDFFGTEGQDDWGCRAKATELSTGELLTGPLVTIALSKKEGWYQKGGSKWQTMPEQMLRYRAAAWFVRTIAPEIAMGLQTAEEMRDTYETERDGETYTVAVRGQSSSDLNAMLHAEVPTVEAEVMPEPERVKSEQELKDERDFAERLAAKKGYASPEAPPQTERKRLTQEELDSMRVDMVTEIEGKGIDVAEIEKMVDCYSAKWTPAHVEKIRTKLLPNLMAELMGA